MKLPELDVLAELLAEHTIRRPEVWAEELRAARYDEVGLFLDAFGGSADYHIEPNSIGPRGVDRLTSLTLEHRHAIEATR